MTEASVKGFRLIATMHVQCKFVLSSSDKEDLKQYLKENNYMEGSGSATIK